MQQLLAMKLILTLTLGVAVLALSAGTATATCDTLTVGHYRQSCRAAETIVRDTVKLYFSKDQTVTAPLLRLHFHDCFVRVNITSIYSLCTKKKINF
mgnify:CR=1 FL=1